MTHSKSKLQNQKFSLPRHDRYKDSGVEWLGEVPEHWTAEKGKWLFVKMDRPVRAEDDVVTAFRDGQVTLRTNRRTEGFTNAIKEHGYQGIRKGDLVIHAMDAFAGAIGVSESDGKSTPVYSACVPRKPNTVTPELYAYLLRYMAHSGFITTLSKGIRERSTDFRFNDFGALELPLPPKPEQDRIVAFLDQKTAEIDTLIAKKQRQIELLDEQKAILINRAVTRGLSGIASATTGLNPNAKLKPSCIEWIGEIPEHWEVKKLKYLARINPSVNIRMSEIVTFLPMERVGTDGSLSLSTPVEAKTLPSSLTAFSRGDVLLAKITSCFENGKGADLSLLPTINGLGSTEFHVLRPNLTGPRFLRHLTSTAAWRRIAECFMQGSAGQKRVTTEYMANSYFPLPPLDEQEAIASHVEGNSDAHLRLSQKIQFQIESLQLFRRTLIGHAVTGGIKV